MDYASLRKRMVQHQLIPRGIKAPLVLEALSKVERHKFIPEALRRSAYADHPVAIGEDQTISQPFIVALMTECLDLSGQERVLEIGTGSGYQTAILAELSAQVYTIERISELAEKAQSLLSQLGYVNIKAKINDGTLGWPEKAPFSRIIVTAAASKLPTPLVNQLSDGGKMILPLGESYSQALTLITKEGKELKEEFICNCIFVPLIGKYTLQN